MAQPLRSTLLLFMILLSQASFRGAESVVNDGEVEQKQEEFTEELLLRPLPDHKLLTHFHFQSKAPPSISNGRHHHLFPKAIAQLSQKFHLKEMELSFTQGRWNYERWGGSDPISSSNAKPPGVELWAIFDVPQSQVDAYWKNLTHTLSGLFCASINFLESSDSYSAPAWAFRPASTNLRYGALPREAVCTENLTPWLKLLPCRDKAGLSSLMDRPSIYRGFYHSQQLRLTSSRSSSERVDSGIFLEQTLTVVLQPNSQRNSMTYSGQTSVQPSWSISSIFGRKVNGKCVLAKSSNVYLQFESGLVTKLKKLQKEYDESWDANIYLEGLQRSFELSVNPDRVLEEVNSLHGKASSVVYQFSVEKYSDSEPFDLGLKWMIPVIWSCEQAPLHVSRFLMGSGNERGAIAISLKSTDLSEEFHGATVFDNSCKLQVDLFQVVPWYIRVYYHSLKVFVDQQPKAAADVIEKMHVAPSKDKVSPGLMEMVLKLPCSVKSAALTLEFDKGFLHIDEYPPDANQGFDIPSAAISFPNIYASIFYPLNKSPVLSKFQEKSPVMSYTEVLLVPLTTPDFSMPYNVITITCTIFALYFGSLLNVLRRRVGEEERYLKSKANKTGRLPQLLSKLSAKLRGRPLEPSQSSSVSLSLIRYKLLWKVILVVVIAVGWQYHFKMTISEIDKKLIGELEALGFPLARAARALCYSSNGSIEAAVNWIIDHENDPDIDEMPLVAVNIDIESPQPNFMTEEMKTKAEDLRNRTRRRKEGEEKKWERDQEKERIRAGKELLEAKLIAEDNERKRHLALRKAEKEEEQRARENIRQKLEADKAERRRMLGYPSQINAAVKPITKPVMQERENGLPVMTIRKDDCMRECLRSLRRNYKDNDARVKRAFHTLLIYVGNVAKNPDEEKFRRIRVSNPLFQDRVGSLQGGIEFLELCGFERIEGDRFLFLARDKIDLAVLNSAAVALKSAISNPFFGLLSR
ncbi:Gpi16 domain-containing protein/PUB domain-containing protein, partial [Cephalotus follicularis]